jgi:RNA polymerase sigma-70 factor, ECF subfamily
LFYICENNFPLTTSQRIEDSTIVSLFREDNQQAISLAYDKFHAALFGTIIKIVLSNELAEEVLQDVFVKAWKSRDQYDDSKGRLFTWLINIARNTAIDYTRLKSFSQKNQDLETSVSSIDRNDQVAFNEEIIGVKEIVNQMPEEYRVLVELIYFQGFTHAEAAETLNIPLGTVKTRIRNAVLQLRKYFTLFLFLTFIQ